MNPYFYESMAKEKIKKLREEGMRNQAFHRSGAPNLDLLPGLPKLILGFLGILGLLGMLFR